MPNNIHKTKTYKSDIHHAPNYHSDELEAAVIFGAKLLSRRSLSARQCQSKNHPKQMI